LAVGRKYLAYGGLKRKSDNVDEELERDIRCNGENRADILGEIGRARILILVESQSLMHDDAVIALWPLCLSLVGKAMGT
jgi:hypothetical protein